MSSKLKTPFIDDKIYLVTRIRQCDRYSETHEKKLYDKMLKLGKIIEV